MEEARSDTAPTSFAYRLRRDAGGAMDRIRPLWGRRLFRWLAILLGGFLLAVFLFWLIFARGLPGVVRRRQVASSIGRARSGETARTPRGPRAA